jgi:hypothetical protein
MHCYRIKGHCNKANKRWSSGQTGNGIYTQNNGWYYTCSIVVNASPTKRGKLQLKELLSNLKTNESYNHCLGCIGKEYAATTNESYNQCPGCIQEMTINYILMECTTHQ